MVELGSEEVQECTEKGMWGQRKTAVDVSGEQDALTLLRLRLSFIPREPPETMLNQPALGQILQFVQLDCGLDPDALNLAAWQGGSRRRPAPAGLLPLRRPLLCAL